jgi:adenine-specific DNA methylase
MLNFRITDDSLGIGSEKKKYNFNVSAIRLLKQIESENRLANRKEQKVLSRYVGWGEISEAFNKNNTNWRKEYEELKTLLSDGEYEAARASTLDAHYTSPTIIKAIYEVIEKMGFTKGNILEPSMGIGNFFGLLPESMNESRLYGVELDSVTGRIAKQLYQNANITVSGYEKTSFPDNFFDIAIGNVPFGDHAIKDSKYDKHNFRIHDYFFAKTLDQVRPGGVIAFVTSKGTLDKANPAVRKYLAQRAELIGAIRPPNSAFMENAGTEVTADIVFLQKRDRLMDIEPNWIHLSKTADGIPINSYFADNPHMILGKIVMNKSMYGREFDTACIPSDNSPLAEQLEKAIVNVLGKITERVQETDFPEGAIPADPNVQNFTYTLVDGELYYRENSIMKKPDMPKTTTNRAINLVKLRDCVKTLIDYQLNDHSDKEIAEKQSELNNLYDRFTAKFGLINDRENERAFKGDSSYYLL